MRHIFTITIATIALTFVTFKVIKYLINKFREFNMVTSFSGPTAYPIIGNLNLLLGDMKDITCNIIKYSNIYTSPWRLWIGPKLFIILSDPKHLQILTKSSYGNKNETYDYMKYFVGNGLITAPISLWKIHRKLLSPGFGERSRKTYITSVIKHAKRFARILGTLNGKDIDIFHYVHLCATDIICDSQFEIDLDLQKKPECNHPAYISESLLIPLQRIIKFWLRPEIIFRYSSMGKKAQKILSYLNEISDEIIRKRKESIRRDKIILESEDHKNARKNTSTLLDLLFKSFYETGEYSEQQIKDEIHTMLIAGSETVAISISFLLLMLATFPEIQERVYEELYQIYGSSDDNDVPITYEDTKNMIVLERVIKETLRLFPPVPLIGRIFTEDIKVDEKIILPKNCNVVFAIFKLHRNEKYWKDSLTFNPDRFLAGNYDRKCFFPFSSGNRDCIGQRFAMIEMKGIIATVLRKFIVQIDNPVKIEDISLEYGITIKSVEPILLRFNKR